MKLSEKLSRIAPSVTLQITAEAKKLKESGENVISFAAGEPDFDTPQVIKDAAIKAIQNGFTKYTLASGMLELKEAISNKFKLDNGLDYAANQIVVSCGAKHSLYNALAALINDGDEVIIPSPYWLSYPEMVKSLGGQCVFLETEMKDGFKLRIDMLKRAITDRSKVLILNSPSNPTGGIYGKAELEQIADEVTKSNLFVISDEIYEKLIYDNEKHVSIASLGDEIKKRTITVNGMSKAYSMTGWRLGYLAAEPVISKMIAAYQSHATSNPTSFAQVGGVEALINPSVRAEVETMRQAFETRRNLMLKMIAKMPKITAFVPKGAFYLFCDIANSGMSSLEFSSKLLDKQKVAVIPGEAFGADAFIRLSFATSEKNISEGLSRLESFLKTI